MSDRSAEEIIKEVETFLKVNFPQIEMHGGSADVKAYNSADEEIVIRLGDACGGCSISDMTMQAINRRLTKQVPEINRVDVGEKGAVDPTDGPFQ